MTFTIPEENADISGQKPEGTVQGDPTLSVTVKDPTDDTMTVAFKRGEQYELGDENITRSSGVSDVSGTASQVFGADSGDGFPFEVFEVKLGEGLGEESAGKHMDLQCSVGSIEVNNIDTQGGEA